MARFCVYINSEGAGYLLDIQADLLSQLNTRIVVPLLPLDTAPMPAKTLNPVIDINGIASASSRKARALPSYTSQRQRVPKLASQESLRQEKWVR